jgi:uncharacterized protein (TIGR02145 family)
MASYVKLKKGGLVLNAERDDEPASVSVFVNGKQVGETPFSGTVPVCAEIEVGKNRAKIKSIKLKHNEKVTHTIKNSGTSNVSDNSLTDSRDKQKYRTVKIGNQTWMAENLNYNASGSSKCYNNQDSYCVTYGRLYDLGAAMVACPTGWHLPSDAEWNTLGNSVGGTSSHLKATNGWNSNGNGLDTYGFSALPGGHGNSDGYFNYVGRYGHWWSSTENGSDLAYNRSMYYNNEDVDRDCIDKGYVFSVRCLQD